MAIHTNRRFLIYFLTLACLFAAGIAQGQDTKQADDIETQWLTNTRQVTSGFSKAGEGYFSADGKTIVYQAIRKEYPFYQDRKSVV